MSAQPAVLPSRIIFNPVSNIAPENWLSLTLFGRFHSPSYADVSYTSVDEDVSGAVSLIAPKAEMMMSTIK